MKALLLGFLFCAIRVFAQPQPMGFLSQDSLLRIYYAPKARWADSVAQTIRQQATGHHLAEIYLQIKTLQQKHQTANQPHLPNSAPHSAIFNEEIPFKKRKKGNLTKKTVEK